MDFLTRDDILGMDDIGIKSITIPSHIKGWGGKVLFIRQLSRGEQDAYLKRQFEGGSMKQNIKRSGEQQLIAPNLFGGHDGWLFCRGVCDANGKALFTDQDMNKILAKNGEAIGWVAKQIIEFSDMRQDVDEIDKLEEDVKN